MSAMGAVLISIALRYFFYVPRSVLCFPLKALLFPIPPLCLALLVSPGATLGRSGMGLVLDGALALRLL